MTRPAPKAPSRRAARKGGPARSRRRRVLRWLLVLVGAGLLLVIGLVVVAFATISVPPPQDAAGRSQATIIQWADGSEMARIGSENRVDVPLSRVPDPVQKAVLAAENRGYYTDPGISLRGIARALFTNASGSGGLQGGSTITQQYAKNAYLTQERTYTRKLKELVIAIKLDRQYSKDKVLEYYLNTIYFGRGAYGIQAASETYFGKDVKSLTVQEGAVLASSVRSPALYDPTKHPERAQARYRYVLRGMAGQGWLPRTTATRLEADYPTTIRPVGASRNAGLTGPTGYLVDYARDELVSKGGFDDAQIDVAGYRVRTTIVKPVQAAAVAAVEGQVTATDDPQAALVSVEPGTGAIKAYYGGRGNAGGGFDFARQGAGRPAGSSMKPYVLAAVLEDGISLRSRYNGSSPQRFTGYPKPVSNFGDEQFGSIDLVTATQHSVNTVYVALTKKAGTQAVADLAHKAGISESHPLADTSGDQPGLGIGLGIYDVSVVDQAVGYATFAAGGVRAEPFMVQRVLSAKGEVLYSAKKVTDRAFSEDTARDATYALEKVVTGGTGSRARVSGREVAGKTGTTQDNQNAWFVGYTATPKEGTTGAVRQLSTAVWLGYPQPKAMRGVAGVSGEVTGGSAPARIFHDYLAAALEGVPTATFPSPVYGGKTKNGPGASVPTSTAPGPRPSASATAQPTGGPSTGPSLPPAPSDPPSPQPSEPPVPTAAPTPAPAESPPPKSPGPAPSRSAAPAAGPAPGPGSRVTATPAG